MIQLDVFNDDEKQYLNALTKGRFREKISRQDVLKAVAFARDVADDTDTMILDLIDGVYSKGQQSVGFRVGGVTWSFAVPGYDCFR